ncbi:MAG: NAD(P)/FAD-dependent oxidoreductase [Dysgonomonas sp.]
MQKDIDLRITPQQASDKNTVKTLFSAETGVLYRDIDDVQILRRSIDARQRNIFVNLRVRGYINEPKPEIQYQKTEYPDVSKSANTAIVVGAGPAGLFAALRLIELGIKPVVLERGKDVHKRKFDTALLNKEQVVNPESNYCFGEGGAGAYSDGKLYTRSKKRGNVEKILNVFCQHGANTDILVDAHPHIGTDKLPSVIENIREQIKQSGGEVYFETRVDSLIISDKRVKGVETNTGEEFFGKVILATGHSARDVYRMLDEKGVYIEEKGLAVGVRIEHPAHLIDQIQYHNEEGRGEYLPAAEYSFAEQVEGRGVYSFCMCPGGIIIPSASDRQQLVVNGMSASNRGSKWSNSGVVVEIHPEDFPEYAKYGKLSMLHFQEEYEKEAWIQGGKTQIAPAQRMTDFVNNTLSSDLPVSSYVPGIVSSPLHSWLPPFINTRLREGLKMVSKKMNGFLTNEAVLLGVESRTSSPVRITRDRDTLQHIEISGLYPCGEGAGYAGGIVSAAMDGERCAEALARTY